MIWSPSLVTVLSLASPAVQATGAPTTRVEGRVLLADGTAWTGAAVALVSASWRWSDSAPFVDLLETVSDGNGGFGVDVIAGRTYSAWAHAAPAAGLYRVSETIDGVVAGQTIELRERDGPRRIVEVGIRGLDAWSKAMPLSCEVLCLIGDRLVLPCELDESGTTVIPPVPADSVLLRVRTRNDLEIAIVEVPVSDEGRTELAADVAEAGTASAEDPGELVTLSEARSELTLPPPVPVRLELTGPGPSQGRPRAVGRSRRPASRRGRGPQGQGRARFACPVGRPG